MPVTIVVKFEVIHVDEDEGDHVLRALRPPPFSRESVVELTTIGDARQCVDQSGLSEDVRHVLEAELSLDPRHHQRRTDGFRDEIGRAHRESFHLERLVAVRRHEDDRNIGDNRIPLQGGADLESAQARHLSVQKNHIGSARACQPQGVRSVGREPHATKVAQDSAEQLDSPCVVIDDQDVGCRRRDHQVCRETDLWALAVRAYRRPAASQSGHECS